MDRADALNSAVFNERDLGAFFYFAPEKIRSPYTSLVRDNLKGSCDYGVFGFGVYNGQTANRPELNNTLHIVSRLSYPFEMGSQIIEPGIQTYVGKFVVPSEYRITGVKSFKSFEFNDQRMAGCFILYPKPFGIQAEYNVGNGPQYNPTKDSNENRNLKGGYANFSYKAKGKRKDEYFFPFTRIQSYDGEKKHELDARSYRVREIESGVEWQVNKSLGITASYVISNRRFEDSKLRNNDQQGRLLRLQAQLNF
jgi:hypothetical protein